MKKLSETLLISEELLKLYSNISRNVGVDKIFPFVGLAQSFYIEEILGTPLLQELQDEIASETLTNENKALIIKIAPCLSLYSEYLALRSLAYSITQKGLTKESSDNSQSLDDKEITTWRNEVLSNAELSKELLIKYLCNCSDLYPLWTTPNNCDCDKFKPKMGSAKMEHQFQIYFPKKMNKCDKCK